MLKKSFFTVTAQMDGVFSEPEGPLCYRWVIGITETIICFFLMLPCEDIHLCPKLTYKPQPLRQKTSGFDTIFHTTSESYIFLMDRPTPAIEKNVMEG